MSTLDGDRKVHVIRRGDSHHIDAVRHLGKHFAVVEEAFRLIEDCWGRHLRIKPDDIVHEQWEGCCPDHQEYPIFFNQLA
ncbi:MAG: hypothetical protein AAGC54_14675 [Cyanobacteria bacterium P01_F01_bin.4]